MSSLAEVEAAALALSVEDQQELLARLGHKYVLLSPKLTAERANESLSLEERMRRWKDEERQFLEQMRGPDVDPRSVVELIREGRDR
jgi:hypothetical protein